MSKEIRYRVWWSVYTLENTLSIMMGQPTSAPDNFSTTPLPIPFDEEQFREPMVSRLLAYFAARTEFMQMLSSRRRVGSVNWDSPGLGHAPLTQAGLPCPMDIAPSNSFYFFYFMDLTLIMRRAIDLLYSPAFAQRPWLTISASVTDLVQETEEWLSRVSCVSIQNPPSIEPFRAPAMEFGVPVLQSAHRVKPTISVSLRETRVGK
ncbi:hypothetical protein ACMYSQ_012447 [Aspergillus niger]